MKLISTIKAKAPKYEQLALIDWILSTIRHAREKDPMAEVSKLIRGDHNYGWFEVFTLDEETFEFKL